MSQRGSHFENSIFFARFQISTKTVEQKQPRVTTSEKFLRLQRRISNCDLGGYSLIDLSLCYGFRWPGKLVDLSV